MSWFTDLFKPKATTTQSPSSSLSHDDAGRWAAGSVTQLISSHGNRFEVTAVSNTNSMLPAIDSNCWLILEQVPFESLATGDVVTYYSTTGKRILHALGDRSGIRFWTRGWNNARHDNEYVTPSNFDRRLLAIVYSQHSSTTRL